MSILSIQKHCNLRAADRPRPRAEAVINQKRKVANDIERLEKMFCKPVLAYVNTPDGGQYIVQKNLNHPVDFTTQGILETIRQIRRQYCLERVDLD